MSTPVVSAILTAYNNAATIGPAIESILRQTYQDFEIIVVDDGSKDDTARVVTQYGDRVRYILRENGGSAKARNTGCRASQGKYLAFLDGDDESLPRRFEREVAKLEEDSRVALVYGNFCLMDQAGQHVRLRWGTGRYLSGDVFEPLLIRNFVPFSSIMVRRDALFSIGLFDETLRSSEDWDMLIRLAKDHRFAYVDHAMMKYRIVPNSKSANVIEKEKAYRNIQSRIFARDDIGPRKARLRRLSDAAVEFGVLSLSMRYGKYSNALTHAIRAFKIDPTVFWHFRYELMSRLMTPLFGRVKHDELSY